MTKQLFQEGLQVSHTKEKSEQNMVAAPSDQLQELQQLHNYQSNVMLSHKAKCGNVLIKEKWEQLPPSLWILL